MEYKRMVKKKCAWCGKKFETGRDNQLYCGDECKRQRKNQTSREYRLKVVKKEQPQRRNQMSQLAVMNAKARAAGMSYGQYDVALRLGRVANG